MTISDGQRPSYLRHDFSRQLRSSSPAVKRPASDMEAQDREDHTRNVNIDRGSSPPDISINNRHDESNTTEMTPKAKQQDTGARHGRQTSVDIFANHPHTATFSEDNASFVSVLDSISQPPASSNASTSATSIEPESAQSPGAPSIDEQVAKVTQLIFKPLQDKQKGYVVSSRWLNRVRARSSDVSHMEKFDKSATEGEIGQVDNSDVTLMIEGSEQLLDEAGEPFFQLRPGLQLGEDYQIVPEEAWNLIQSWYGVAGPVITRYVHNTTPGDEENCQYELNPPIFSLLKLSVNTSDVAGGASSDSKPPQRIIASRWTPFNTWLKKSKRLVSIDVNSKVRVWKVLGGLRSTTGSGLITPIASRSASPAPGATIVASAGDRMIIDVNTFNSLRVGDERELLDVKDQTMNEKYNGKQTLSIAGLSKDEVVVLEEQIGGPGGGEWPSEVSKSGSGFLSISKSAAMADKSKGKSLIPSGRSSPGPGMMTRGRQRRDGRPRGITGLTNLGNTCYMNSALQCVRSVEELTQFFLHGDYKEDLNVHNPLGHRGEVAEAYARLLNSIYNNESAASFSPSKFKQVIGRYGPNFAGYGQQDSQEFLLFLLDGLHEDLNRVQKKPYIVKPDSTDEMVHDYEALKAFADENWRIYKARNDSVITDLFAGMYKSTVICPVCDKVSIIFDPFNNLTLQLPVENNWSRELYFFPLHGRPIRIDVDIDKHASIRAVKEYVANKVDSDASRLVMVESYRFKFYKMFDDVSLVSESNIQNNDIVCLYELESVPTNYDPKKQKKTSFYGRDLSDDIPDPESPRADRILVPVFNRKTNLSRNQRVFFGQPYYVVISREDAQDYYEILRKILGKVATLTTRRILDEDMDERVAINSSDDSDTLVMQDDGRSSGSSNVHAESIEGEEEFVDVTMESPDQTRTTVSTHGHGCVHPVLQKGSFIPARLQNMFQMKVFHTGEAIPLGWSQIQENEPYTAITDRMSRRLPHRPARQSKVSRVMNGTEDTVSSDEEGENAARLNQATQSDESDEGSVEHDGSHSNEGSASDDEFQSVSSLINNRPESVINNPRADPKRNKFKFKNRDSRGKLVGKKTHKRDQSPQVALEATDKFLVRPGEGIILDWTSEAYNALFEGDENGEPGMRGSPTWKSVELLKDEELEAKRAQRQTRRRNGVSLDDCLNEFGKMETLSENNAWYCPRCKEHRQAHKMFELWRTPDILVMHLKRFSSTRNFRDKLEIPVRYPVEGLDLTGKVITNEEGKSLIYDLIAVDNHYGGLGGGHYTAFAKNIVNNGWYDYNDSHVSPRSNMEALVTPAAYLLFYRRRSIHPLGGNTLEKIIEAVNAPPANPESHPGSREGSPSGEGMRLDGSSHNGLSSALPLAGPVHRVGVGGAAIQHHGAVQQGDSPMADEPPFAIGEEPLPGYEQAEINHMSEINADEGIGDVDFPMHGPSQPWEDGPSWAFPHLGSGGVHSQITAAPPASVDLNNGEENMYDDAASNRAEGGNASDNDERMGDFIEDDDAADAPSIPRSRTRESAPPPGIIGVEEEEELLVEELHDPPEV